MSEDDFNLLDFGAVLFACGFALIHKSAAGDKHEFTLTIKSRVSGLPKPSPDPAVCPIRDASLAGWVAILQ